MSAFNAFSDHTPPTIHYNQQFCHKEYCSRNRRIYCFFIGFVTLSYVKNRVLTEAPQFVFSLRAGPRLIQPRSREQRNFKQALLQQQTRQSPFLHIFCAKKHLHFLPCHCTCPLLPASTYCKHPCTEKSPMVYYVQVGKDTFL